ncbi:MAG TPA: 2-isopropylmalate synthase [Polyangia bacterium]|nr:2-isopropylmalate synthase [Polyangia bacterium]
MAIPIPSRVHIFDTTLRDGEQSPGCSMTVTEKVRLAHQLAELGVDVMEAGFPIASAGDFEAVQKVGHEVSVKVAALARCTALDIERAAKALEGAKVAPRIHVFLATSDVHLKYKLKKTRAQVLEEAAKAVALARRYVGDVEFSAEDGGRTPVEYLIEVARAVVAAGASTVNVPDTVGYGIPEEYGALIGQVATALGNSGNSGSPAIVSVHCHNDLGLAVANSLSAVQHGARQIECTINGIGERAGNCSLEEIVMVLRTRADKLPYFTGIKTEQLFPSSQLLTEIIGVGVQPNKAIVGRNAFAHEAGIHQDGFLKERTTYEIIEPKSVGVPESRLVLGKHSGRHALHARCAELGLHLDKPQLEEIYARFSAFTDTKKGILDEEILGLANDVLAGGIGRKSA